MIRRFFIPLRLRSVVRDIRGASAVEFALVLPLMVALYLGGSEVLQGISASRKVTLVSRTVADLASQAKSLTEQDMDNILSASASVVSPFPSDPLKVTVSQIKIDEDGVATIDWSKSLNGGTEAGKTPTVPDALKVLNTKSYVIWATAEYDYKPTVGYAITGENGIKLTDQIYMSPRLAKEVCYLNSCSD